MRRRIDLIKERAALLYESIRAQGNLKVNRDNGQHSLLYCLEETNDGAAERYIPKSVYPGRIIQIVPAKEYKFNNRPELNWEGLAIEGIELYTLPVYPRQMLTEPFVPVLAEKLVACIREALEKRLAKVGT